MSFLKSHPFPIEAHFESSTVLTYAIAKEELQHMIPACLTLDTFQDKWGFIAVAMVQTSGLRPKGFPKFMGNNFFLTGYRIFVRFKNSKNKNLRGLYILKSETDKKKMTYLGNIFTHYNYSHIDISSSTENNKRIISSEKGGFYVSIDDQNNECELPNNSPFNSWKEARRYAGPLPHTFTYLKEKNSVLTIKGIRQNWIPKPVSIQNHKIGFIDNLGFNDIHLASAFTTKDIPYQWQKGSIERWK